MSRVVIPVQPLPANGNLNPIVWTAASASNHYYDNSSAKVVLLFKNTDGGSHSAVVSSVADPKGRTGDMTIANAGSDVISAVPPLPAAAWNQTGTNQVFVNSPAGITGCYFAALQLP